MPIRAIIQNPYTGKLDKPNEVLFECFKKFLTILDNIPKNGWLNFTPSSFELWEEAPMEMHSGRLLYKKPVDSISRLKIELKDDEENMQLNKVIAVNGTIRVGNIRALGYIWLSFSEYWAEYQGHIRMNAFKSSFKTRSFGDMIASNIPRFSNEILGFMNSISRYCGKHRIIENIGICTGGDFNDIREYVALHLHKRGLYMDTEVFNLIFDTFEKITEEELGKLMDIGYIRKTSLQDWLKYNKCRDFYRAILSKNGIIRVEGNSISFVARDPISFNTMYTEFRKVIFDPLTHQFASRKEVQGRLRDEWDKNIKSYFEKYGGLLEFPSKK